MVLKFQLYIQLVASGLTQELLPQIQYPESCEYLILTRHFEPIQKMLTLTCLLEVSF